MGEARRPSGDFDEGILVLLLAMIVALLARILST